jgi:hypothetical protein
MDDKFAEGVELPFSQGFTHPQACRMKDILLLDFMARFTRSRC